MAYHFENIKLEKGMYGRSGRSFSQALEELDPSEHYRGTPLEGLDAFQRQLKRFDIHVKGAGSDMVEKFFHTSDSAVLFPEFVSRVVRQGMEEESILPAITATVTKFDGMDYRSIASVPSEEDKKLRRVEEGGCPAAVSGLQPVQRACVGAAVAAACGRPAVFLCGDEREVQVLSADLETLTGRRPVTLLGREWQFRPGAVGSRDWERSRLAALYAIILSFSPKFDALVNSIPTAIVGGVSFVLYGMISAVGVRNVVENKVDLTKSRNLIIAAVIFVCGLGFASAGGITFTVGSADITLTGLAIAALAGVILNAILPGNDYEFGKSVEGDASADLGSY